MRPALCAGLTGLLLVATVPAEEFPKTADLPPVTLQQAGPPPRTPFRGIHPPVRLLDERGQPLVQTGRPLSLMKSCGACHDTGYIAEHNYHAQAGLNERRPAGDGPGFRPWDTSPGLFGRWDPLTYRWLSPQDADKLDLGTADWIRVMGPRHVGGGPAEFSRSGRPLEDLVASQEIGPETHVLDPRTGTPRPWNWNESGTVELNCLLCHMQAPNNTERIRALREGRFRWASSATLLGSGIVERSDSGYALKPEMLGPDGKVEAKAIGIGDPQNDNCRLCHSRACRCRDPVVFENSLDNWATETTGTVFSPERLLVSGMNLAGKSGLSTPWDVHAERLVGCTNCHHAMNNPAYNRKESDNSRPSHLAFEPRRLEEGRYLVSPDHNLTKGHVSQGTVARRFDGTMRNCRDCHHAEAVHDFLPFKTLHFKRLGCQTCHVPRVYAPVRRVTDWTFLTPERGPQVSHRGAAGPVNRPTTLIQGYQPVLLVHRETGGERRMVPHNLIASWFWTEGAPEHPVRRFDLEKALFTARGNYHPDLVEALDRDGDGRLTGQELRLDTPDRAARVAARLQRVGVTKPRIRGEVQPYAVSHGVHSAGSAIRCCLCCHGFDSRITSPIELSSYLPGGVVPSQVPDATTRLYGEMGAGPKGSLRFVPSIDPEVVYIHGANHLGWLDYLGIFTVLVSLLGVGLHGGLRIFSGLKQKRGGVA